MNNNQSNAAAKSEAAIRAFLDGTLAGDKARVRSGLHPDVVFRLPRPTMLAKTVNGAANLADFMVDLLNAAYTDAHATYGVVVCNESGGVAEWRLQATLRSGGPYDQFYCWVFKCADGLITDIHEYIDTHYGMSVNAAVGGRAVAAHAQE